MAAPASRGVLLLIDDDEPIRRIGVRMGQKVGFQVIVAANGEEGVALFATQANAIACVVVDLTMPRMGGVECLHALREIRRDIPVVLSSGFASDEVSARFSSESFSSFLQKPFTFDQFAAVLNEVVGPASA